MWQLWLIIAGICFIVEIATVGFLVFWFGVGALVTMIVSFFVPDIYIQTFIFLITSTVLLFLTKPFVKKFVNKEKVVNTNAYSIIGKTGIVVKEINSILGTGQVKIGTEVWSAKIDSEEIIPVDTEITVTGIDGVKAIVKTSIKSKEKQTVNI